MYGRESADGNSRASDPVTLLTDEDVDRWIAGWDARLDADLIDLADFAARTKDAVGTAISANGEIEVTVTPSGELTAVHFSAEVSRWHPDDLAAELMRTVQKARAGADQVLSDIDEAFNHAAPGREFYRDR